MTCIVGIVQDGKMWMGADTCVSFGDYYMNSEEPKVFINKDIICGVAGPVIVRQELQYNIDLQFVLPDIKAHILTKILPSLKKVDDKDEAELLIGYKGKLYETNKGVLLCSSTKNYASVGAGYAYALGCLYTTRDCKDPEHRILLALEAAEQFSSSVKGPFNVLCL